MWVDEFGQGLKLKCQMRTRETCAENSMRSVIICYISFRNINTSLPRFPLHSFPAHMLPKYVSSFMFKGICQALNNNFSYLCSMQHNTSSYQILQMLTEQKHCCKINDFSVVRVLLHNTLVRSLRITLEGSLLR
jgi:hypothetical protein